MYSASQRLRPLSLSELLDTTFALYRENFALFAGVVAVLQVPLAIIDILVSLGEPSHSQIATTGATPFTINAFTGGAAAYSAYAGAGSLFSLIVTVCIMGALAWAIGQRYLGRQTGIFDAYRAVGIRTFFVLAVAIILYTLGVIVSFIGLIVGALIFAVYFAFVPQVVTLERRGPLAAFRRSGGLVRGQWWRVFGYGLVVFILVGIIGGILGAFIGAVVVLAGGGAAAAAGISALGNILLQPIEWGAFTLLYFDLRIRKEGFDLEQMARDLDAVPS